jgi:hypothetical protein
VKNHQPLSFYQNLLNKKGSIIFPDKTTKMKYAIALIFFITASIAGMAQQPPKKENIRELLVLMGSEKLAMQSLDKMISIYKESMPQVAAEFWNEMKKELKASDFIDMMVPIYDKYYSDDDIVQLLAFYRSPIGQKVIGKTPVILEESMEAGKQWGEKVGEKVISRLKAKGYTS